MYHFMLEGNFQTQELLNVNTVAKKTGSKLK